MVGVCRKNHLVVAERTAKRHYSPRLGGQGHLEQCPRRRAPPPIDGGRHRQRVSHGARPASARTGSASSSLPAFRSARPSQSSVVTTWLRLSTPSGSPARTLRKRPSARRKAAAASADRPRPSSASPKPMYAEPTRRHVDSPETPRSFSRRSTTSARIGTASSSRSARRRAPPSQASAFATSMVRPRSCGYSSRHCR